MFQKHTTHTLVFPCPFINQPLLIITDCVLSVACLSLPVTTVLKQD